VGIPKSITELKFTTALDFAVAAAEDREGAILDMMGFRGVLMCVKFGTIEALGVNSIKAQSGAASNLSDAADLLGTGIAVAADDDNQLFIIDLYEPVERYVRVVVDKDATHTTEEMAWYIQYGARNRPVTVSVANAVTYERHESPAEGTA
jgi:hypothetical protein